MIITVTLNPAVDVTYTVDALTPHTSHRVRSVVSRAGGKGINVARVLSALGHEVTAMGTAGGANGQAVREELHSCGIRDSLTTISTETRRTVTVVDTEATLFNEPGPRVLDEEWQSFVHAYESTVPSADAVALSGSLPQNVPIEAYQHMAAIAAAHDVPVVLDTHGPALRHGCLGRPVVVKPNRDELAETTTAHDLVDAARELRQLGACSVVVSRGHAGLVAVTRDGVWSAGVPEQVAGNPTGAGDAVVAALAAGLVTGQAWNTVVADAVALSAAAVTAPVAGEFDMAAYRRFLPLVRPEFHDAGTAGTTTRPRPSE